MEKIIKNCRGVKKRNDGINRIEKEEQRKSFRAILGFKEHDIILTKEQSVLKSVMDAFEGENMQTQCSVLGNRIDLYFHDYKLAVEVDEEGHKDRNIDHEIKRQEAIKEKLGCEFIRINPDEKTFNRYIKKLTKNSLIDELSSKLLRLEFKEDQFNKNKMFKICC